jgi:predicted RNase H-like HicB family nuclease
MSTVEEIFERLPIPVYITYMGDNEYVAQLASGQSRHAFGTTVVEALLNLEKKLG